MKRSNKKIVFIYIPNIFLESEMLRNDIKLDSGQIDFDYIRSISNNIIEYLKNYSIDVESNYFGQYHIDLTGTRKLMGREIETCGKIISYLKNAYGFNSKIGRAHV